MRRIPRCREIIRLISLGYSDKKISELTGSTRRTVKKFREAIAEKNMEWPLDSHVDDTWIYYFLFPAKEYNVRKERPNVDFACNAIINGSTKKLIYYEYKTDCEKHGKESLQYDQFCRCIREKEKEVRSTTDWQIRPGERVIAFWLKEPLKYADDDGVAHQGRVFIGILPYSHFVYVQMYEKDTKESWTDAHVKMFRYLGGVPKQIYAEKSKSSSYAGEIPVHYKELAEYYGTVILYNEENQYSGEVAEIASWFTDKLEDRICSSYDEARTYVKTILDEYLAEEVREGKSRMALFQEGEAKRLQKLPARDFVPILRKEAKVLFNSHIKFEGNYYSVPFQYAMQKDRTVQVEIARDSVKIYYHDRAIAQHPRIASGKGVYQTHFSDMPSQEEARKMEWYPERFINWAASLGPNTKRVIRQVLESKDIVQKAFIHCRTILLMGDTYGKQEVEKACAKIGPYTKGAIFKIVEKNIKENIKE